MKVKNQVITIKKNNEVLYNIHNRITNNGMDWFVFKNLNEATATPLFPKFLYTYAEFPSYDKTADVKINDFNYAYLKFDTTETLSDISTAMAYDVKTSVAQSNFVYNDNGSEKEKIYQYTVTSVEDARLLTTIGFGSNDSNITSYLFAYIQIGFLGLTFEEDDIIEIVRRDIATTDFEIANYSGSEAFDFGGAHLLRYTAELASITFDGVDGSTYGITYPIEDLTIVLDGTATISIIGFDAFVYGDGNLYPSETLYPSDTLYPEYGEKYTRMIFNYNNLKLVGDSTFTAIIDLNNATISNDGGVITVNYAYERGI